jgi:glutamate dehydrogenase (NADP+)
VLTGKGTEWGGAQVRREATGYGAAFFAQEMLRQRREDLDAKTCVVSGAGNVALYVIEKVQQLGAKVVACSDSGGVLHDPNGIDVDLLKTVKQVQRGRVSEYAELRGAPATFVDRGNIWDIPCDLAIPAATQNEVTARDAHALVRNGCTAVVEAANMPMTPDALALLTEAGVAIGPGKAANAGGVATSALEMQQNASRDTWTFEHTEARLAEIMARIHHTCLETAEEYAAPANYIAGANIAGFLRIGRAMLAFGVI